MTTMIHWRDGSIRARTGALRASATFDFDPDQPRGPDGRFIKDGADGPDGKADGEKADAKAEKDKVDVGLTAPRQVPVAELRAGAAARYMEYFGDVLARSAQMEVIAEKFAREAFPDADGHATVFGDPFAPGGVTVVAGGDWSPDAVAEAVEQVGFLRLTDPLDKPLIVELTQSADPEIDAVLGETFEKGPVNRIVLSEAVMELDLNDIPAGQVSEHGTMTGVEYVLTHEYGHAVAESRDNAIHDLHDEDHASLPATSVYGMANDHEKYAEAYAAWRATNGQTEQALPRALAKQDGWGR